LDYKTVVQRIENEGLSFLTITLPTFGSDFERSLDLGYVDSTLFLSFKKKASLPTLLWGLTSLVFDPGSGKLLDKPDIESIICIRQFCLMWKKVNINCTQKRTENAIKAYIETDEEVARRPDYVALAREAPYSDAGRLLTLARNLWHHLDARLAIAWRNDSIVPKHGPGATAERISGNRKFDLLHWHVRLQERFPIDQFAFPNANWIGHQSWSNMNFLEPGAEPPVRVVTVPKTQKTPRVIAIEPVCMQYTQQAICEFLVREIEHGKLTSGRINFSDQTVNQSLALRSSFDGKYATIDLSEASDRVSLSLVALVFQACPELFGSLCDTRSTKAELPDGKVRPIYKFASMGSALCFPVESCVFFTLALYSRLKKLNLPLTPRNIAKCSRDVYVYGDDIIVPVDEVATVIDVFESFGLKVNHRKSFWTGKFRESCGMDAYDGTRVTPVYLRELPDNRRSKTGIVSLVSFANQLYQAGYWQTARDVRQKVESLVGPLPHVLDTSPGLGWLSASQYYSYQRDCPRYGGPQVRTYVVRAITYDDPIDDYAALMKFFLRRGVKHSPKFETMNITSRRFDSRTVLRHSSKVRFNAPFELGLSKSVRPGGVYIKRQWTRPY
jgi:hypothetical protein